MNYYIMYRSKKKKNWYLTQNNTLTQKRNSKSVQTFGSASKAQKHIFKMKKKSRDTLLKSHSKDNFFILDSNGVQTPLLFEEPTVQPQKTTKKQEKAGKSTMQIVNKKFESFDDLFQALREKQNHALILDLEFVQDSSNTQHMSQIAGMILGQESKSFSGLVFDPQHMNDNKQLDFLKQTDLPYSKASLHDNKTVMKYVQKFMKKNKIDTIVSWGNSADFSVLENEGFASMFAGMITIDLEPVFAMIKGANPSLENICNMLNLKNKGTWHEAFSDVVMIKKICDLYLNVLSPANTKFKASSLALIAPNSPQPALQMNINNEIINENKETDNSVIDADKMIDHAPLPTVMADESPAQDSQDDNNDMKMHLPEADKKIWDDFFAQNYGEKPKPHPSDSNMLDSSSIAEPKSSAVDEPASIFKAPDDTVVSSDRPQNDILLDLLNKNHGAVSSNSTPNDSGADLLSKKQKENNTYWYDDWDDDDD